MGTRYQNPLHGSNAIYNAEGCQSKPAILSTQWQRMIPHPVFDATTLNKAPSFQINSVTDFRNFNSQYDGFNQLRSMDSGLNLPSNNCVNQHRLPQDAGCIYNNKTASSRFIPSDGHKSFSPMGTNVIAAESITSPEQISSITACSEADYFSDGEYLDSGSTFSSPNFNYLSQSLSENCIQLRHVNRDKLGSVDRSGALETSQIVSYDFFSKPYVENGELPHSNAFILEKIPERRFNSLSSVVSGNVISRHGDQYQLRTNACVLEQISERIPERCNSLSRAIASKVISSHQDQYQHHQVYKFPNRFQCNELSKPQHVELPSGKKSENYNFQQSSSNLNHIPVEQQCKIQQQDPNVSKNIGATNFVDSSDMSLKDVLLLYIYCKTAPENKGKNQSDLLYILHNKLCKDRKCNCIQLRTCISRHENCSFNPCKICKPLWESLSIVKSGLGKSKSGPLKAIHNRDLNDPTTSVINDAPPSPKRLRRGDSVHYCHIADSEDQSFRSEGTSDYKNCHDGSLCHGINGVGIKMEEISSPAAYIQAKKNEELHNSEVLIQGLRTEQLHSPEGTIKALDATNHIPEVIENGTGNCHWLKSDSIAVLQQPNVIQESRAVGCKFKPQEQLNVIQNPRDMQCMPKSQEQPCLIQEQQGVQCGLKPYELESKAGIDSSETVQSHQLRTSSGDSGNLPISYVDFLSSEQIKEHISSLQSLEQPSRTKSKQITMANCFGDSSCQLCFMSKLVFNPAPLYCSCCCNLVKQNSVYYWGQDEMGSKHFFCPLCFKVSRGSSILFQGRSFSKAQMWKERNISENEESWVQCDKCQRWLHQICGLYNAKRDMEGKAKYICPYCRLEEIKLAEHVPLPAAFAAKDLPRTMLSDHIEKRLFRQLQREREERATFLNKDTNEVPQAEELVVRVVSSVSKVVKVNKDFLDICPDVKYPEEFPYKSKVIVLFQKIEGIDVCLFCMYVQEYGSDCDEPNHRSVYISYLDSIKYFRPEIQTVTGEALRTFIYHEILIGYLDYCKRKGFATCYIWACPPYKKEDYIFNSHPDSQKIPKPDKLRQWYKSMLKRAMNDGVVVNYTTFYESFFIQNGDCNIKITAARLPYFDGDYWSDAAEAMIRKMEKENGGESEGKVKKPLTKRTMKAMGHNDLNIHATKDILVMQKLGQTILPTKENFLVVQLLFTCNNCHNLILSGEHWFCNQCKNFYFCSRCPVMDRSQGRNVHNSPAGEEHLLSKVVINDLPADTAEEAAVLDNDIFENRHSFLSFCQGNNYQFNTLRRAKHSSMMILYDLHKQMWLTRKIGCNICHKDITVEARWHCEICPKFDVCGTCFKVGLDNHNHKLILHFPKADCGVNKFEALPEKADQVQYRNALEHASQCRSSKSNPCFHPDCFKIKRFLHHLSQCNIRPNGGCTSCWRIWILIRLHSVRCKDSNCRVPRCQSVKEHGRYCSGWCRYCSNWLRFLAKTRCVGDDLGQILLEEKNKSSDMAVLAEEATFFGA